MGDTSFQHEFEIKSERFALPPNPITAYVPDAAVMLELSYVHEFFNSAHVNPLPWFREHGWIFWFVAFVSYASVWGLR